MLSKQILLTALFAFAGFASTSAYAIQDCSLNGEDINLNNGNSTKGKTGLIRCKDRDTGVIQREQEVKDGVMMGIVRYYEKGKVSKEQSVNERGNMNGRAREFAPNGQAISDNMYENGKHVGLGQWFFDTGKLKRATFYEEDREKASVEWNENGQLRDLRCGDKPVLSPAIDDKKLCGFAGTSDVQLFNSRGEMQTRIAFTDGKRSRYETFYGNGKTQQLQEISATKRVERRFSDDGTKRREIESTAGNDGRLSKTMEQEFSERGGLVHEQRWNVDGTPVSDITYYLNGQPREKSTYVKEDGKDYRIDNSFFDSGKLASEGRYITTANQFRIKSTRPVGSHKGYNEQGKLVAESIYDDKGKVSREKAWDADGKLVRDDEVFEDGSRKAFAK